MTFVERFRHAPVPRCPGVRADAGGGPAEWITQLYSSEPFIAANNNLVEQPVSISNFLNETSVSVGLLLDLDEKVLGLQISVAHPVDGYEQGEPG